MNVKRIFPKLLVLATMYSVQSPGADPGGELLEAPDDALVFVYLHGFGGVRELPEFCENLEEFFIEEQVVATVLNYEWDSVKLDPLSAAAGWLKAQEMADLEAPKFKREVIDQLERDGKNYVLVGFSVGSRVVLNSLEATTAELKGLRGVYFLGSAMTKDSTLKNRAALPDGMRITNYHSPRRDLVHRMAFNFISDVPPGGQVGFADETLFENLPVSCAHAHKGVGIPTDYSGLAEAIAFLELHEAGVEVPGGTKLNWITEVDGGKLWWNKLKRIGDIDLEQHTVRRGYYRAVRVDKHGRRFRVARGENLHAIIERVEGLR